MNNSSKKFTIEEMWKKEEETRWFKHGVVDIPNKSKRNLKEEDKA